MLNTCKKIAGLFLLILLTLACKSGTATTPTTPTNPNSLVVTEIKVWAMDIKGTPIQINGTYKNTESEDVQLTGSILLGDGASHDLSNIIVIKANTEKSWTIEDRYTYAPPMINKNVTIQVNVSAVFKAGKISASRTREWNVI